MPFFKSSLRIRLRVLIDETEPLHRRVKSELATFDERIRHHHKVGCSAAAEALNDAAARHRHVSTTLAAQWIPNDVRIDDLSRAELREKIYALEAFRIVAETLPAPEHVLKAGSIAEERRLRSLVAERLDAVEGRRRELGKWFEEHGREALADARHEHFLLNLAEALRHANRLGGRALQTMYALERATREIQEVLESLDPENLQRSRHDERACEQGVIEFMDHN